MWLFQRKCFCSQKLGTVPAQENLGIRLSVLCSHRREQFSFNVSDIRFHCSSFQYRMFFLFNGNASWIPNSLKKSFSVNFISTSQENEESSPSSPHPGLTCFSVKVSFQKEFNLGAGGIIIFTYKAVWLWVWLWGYRIYYFTLAT